MCGVFAVDGRFVGRSAGEERGDGTSCQEPANGWERGGKESGKGDVHSPQPGRWRLRGEGGANVVIFFDYDGKSTQGGCAKDDDRALPLWMTCSVLRLRKRGQALHGRAEAPRCQPKHVLDDDQAFRAALREKLLPQHRTHEVPVIVSEDFLRHIEEVLVEEGNLRAQKSSGNEKSEKIGAEKPFLAAEGTVLLPDLARCPACVSSLWAHLPAEKDLMHPFSVEKDKSGSARHTDSHAYMCLELKPKSIADVFTQHGHFTLFNTPHTRPSSANTGRDMKYQPDDDDSDASAGHRRQPTVHCEGITHGFVCRFCCHQRIKQRKRAAKQTQKRERGVRMDGDQSCAGKSSSGHGHGLSCYCPLRLFGEQTRYQALEDLLATPQNNFRIFPQHHEPFYRQLMMQDMHGEGDLDLACVTVKERLRALWENFISCSRDEARSRDAPSSKRKSGKSNCEVLHLLSSILTSEGILAFLCANAATALPSQAGNESDVISSTRDAAKQLLTPTNFAAVLASHARVFGGKDGSKDDVDLLLRYMCDAAIKDCSIIVQICSHPFTGSNKYKLALEEGQSAAREDVYARVAVVDLDFKSAREKLPKYAELFQQLQAEAAQLLTSSTTSLRQPEEEGPLC